jgi:hypothetical protein
MTDQPLTDTAAADADDFEDDLLEDLEDEDDRPLSELLTEGEKAELLRGAAVGVAMFREKGEKETAEKLIEMYSTELGVPEAEVRAASERAELALEAEKQLTPEEREKIIERIRKARAALTPMDGVAAAGTRE